MIEKKIELILETRGRKQENKVMSWTSPIVFIR